MISDQESIQLKERIQELETENQTLKKGLVEIHQAKELYLKIFENFPALIWRSRLDMLCDYFNKTWLEFTGRTMDQEFGNGWAEGVHPDDFDQCLKTYVEAFEKREAFVMVYRMKNKLGEYAWIRDFGRPFYDLDNTFLGYIGSCYDITVLKNNEFDLIKLNETKDKFLSIISHDLKNPINTIISLSEMLVRKVQSNDLDAILEYANNIKQSTQRVKNLLLNLLEWSISQSGKMEFHPIKISLKSVIQEIVELAEQTLKQKEITIDVAYVENDLVLIDKEMICTVIRNFLSNAIKFSFPGGKIRIQCHSNGKRIALSISDSGIGMSPKTLNSLFKIGESFSSKGTKNETGTGIGLILCKEFLEKHDSQVFVESIEGKGSTFKFSLPIVEAV